MRPEPNDLSHENALRVIVIKDAYLNAGQSVKWQEVGILTQCKDIVGSEDRLERSQHFGDVDYEGHVLNVVESIIARDPRNENRLIQYVLSKLSQADGDQSARDRLRKIADYLEIINVIGTGNLADSPHIRDHVNRIEQTLFNDPEAAIGFCKDLVESSLKDFLETSDDEPQRYKMPQLIKAARDKLSADTGSLEHDEDMLKTLSNFGQIIGSIATLRNKHGTGHGRGPADTFNLPQPYVVLAANAAISMAVFLTQMHDSKTAEPDGAFKAVDSPSNVDEGEDLPW